MPAPPVPPSARSRIRSVCAMSARWTPSRSPPTQVRAARHAYYGAIAYVDDNLGRLMAALRATGLADDTIVIFPSDHGEMLGDRGLWYKMSFFEGPARVPLVIAQPGPFRAARVGASVSLVDLVPTFVDLAGGDAARARRARSTAAPSRRI